MASEGHTIRKWGSTRTCLRHTGRAGIFEAILVTSVLLFDPYTSPRRSKQKIYRCQLTDMTFEAQTERLYDLPKATWPDVHVSKLQTQCFCLSRCFCGQAAVARYVSTKSNSISTCYPSVSSNHTVVQGQGADGVYRVRPKKKVAEGQKSPKGKRQRRKTTG